MPLNFLSITSNFKSLLSSCCKSSGCKSSLTIAPFLNLLTRLPLISPKSEFSKVSSSIIFAEAVLKTNPEDVQKKMDKALGRVQVSDTN